MKSSGVQQLAKTGHESFGRRDTRMAFKQGTDALQFIQFPQVVHNGWVMAQVTAMLDEDEISRANLPRVECMIGLPGTETGISRPDQGAMGKQEVLKAAF